MKHSRRWLAASAALMLVLSACGDNGGGTSIVGAVTYQGQPLADGAIYFLPADGGRPAVAKIDQLGKYSIDVPPGDYKVTVTKSDPVPAGWKEGDPLPPATVALPAQYTEPAKTVLSATVVEEQESPIDFDLK